MIDGKPGNWLLRLLAPHWALWAGLGALMLLEAIARLAVPLYYKLVFDHVLGSKDQHLLLLMLGGILGVLVILAIVEFAQSSVCASLGVQTINEWRAALYERVQNVPLEFVGGISSGDLVARFSNDIGAIGRLVTISFYKVVVNGAIAALAAIALFVVEWRLALFSVAIMTLAVVLPKRFGSGTVAAERARRRDDGVVSSEVSEALAAHRVVRAFSLESYMTDRFAAALDSAYASGRQAVLLTSNLDKTLGLALLFGQVLIVALGAYLVTLGYLTAGGLVGFVGLLLGVSTAITSLTAYIPDFVQGASAAARLREIFDLPVGPAEEDGDHQAPHVREGIAFKNVSFKYGDRIALDDVTLSVRAGESVAFVGRSGSGKSTLVSLLMRFYDPSAGTITFDGRDARAIAPRALRSLVGIVFQSTFLFHASARQNIRIGKIEAPDADVERAAQAAQIHDAIVDLPQGYDTVVGETGAQLSGGQQQRLALARAIVRDPRVLIMDEATSALDPTTESAVNETLKLLAKDRTSITVTHRLGSVTGMDRIFVFDKGRLVESGTHDELLALRGTFFGMWQKQTNFSVNGTGTHARLGGLFLRTVPVFATLDDERLAALADMFQSEFHDAGEQLIEEGELGDKLYVIVRGRVEVQHAEATWILEDGDFFGEIALLADIPRTATVRTLQRCLLLALRREQFRTFLDESPEVRPLFERVMRERLESAAG